MRYKFEYLDSMNAKCIRSIFTYIGYLQVAYSELATFYLFFYNLFGCQCKENYWNLSGLQKKLRTPSRWRKIELKDNAKRESCWGRTSQSTREHKAWFMWLMFGLSRLSIPLLLLLRPAASGLFAKCLKII